jgi:hypothetical protein
MGLDCMADLLATKPTSSMSLHKLLLVPQTGHLPQFQNHNISICSRQSYSSYPIANWLTETFSTLPPLRSIVQITLAMFLQWTMQWNQQQSACQQFLFPMWMEEDN